MKKAIAILFVLAALAFSTFAQEETEPTTVLEGTVLSVQGSGGIARVMLRLANGETVTMELPRAEVTRLRIRARDAIKVGGIFIGASSGTKAQSRILARTLVKAGKESAIANPVGLTEQDRLQIRAYADAQLKTQTQTQLQTQTQTQTQLQTQTETHAGESGQAGSGSEGGQAQTGKK